MGHCETSVRVCVAVGSILRGLWKLPAGVRGPAATAAGGIAFRHGVVLLGRRVRLLHKMRHLGATAAHDLISKDAPDQNPSAAAPSGGGRSGAELSVQGDAAPPIGLRKKKLSWRRSWSCEPPGSGFAAVEPPSAARAWEGAASDLAPVPRQQQTGIVVTKPSLRDCCMLPARLGLRGFRARPEPWARGEGARRPSPRNGNPGRG